MDLVSGLAAPYFHTNTVCSRREVVRPKADIGDVVGVYSLGREVASVTESQEIGQVDGRGSQGSWRIVELGG